MDALLLKSLGPGIITGADDDNPSGIATYFVADTQLGTQFLWTALPTWPLMRAVQILCTRIGLVTGQDLARNFEQRFPDWLSGIFVMDRRGDHHSGDVRRWLTFTHLVRPQKRPHRVQRYIEILIAIPVVGYLRLNR
jgi:hypothetical protein